MNPWGIVFNPFGFVWVADNGTGLATLYDGFGNPQSLVVTIPKGNPTGIVFNGSSDFVVTKGQNSGPGLFIFSTENGVIAAWAPSADPTNAISMVDNSASGAVYKGLALAANGTAQFLYATDFHHNRIDVFDKDFKPATPSSSCSFADPKMQSGFAPFGIQNLDGNIYVTYAKQDNAKHDDVAGRGFGFVNVFDANGCLLKRLARRGQLNAPWGMAIAPADFGRFSNTLLIGNFGDGRINAFDIASGNFRGQLRTNHGKPLSIDGLWGLRFGNGLNNQPTNALFFTAGPNEEAHGLYGEIEAQ